MIVNVLFFKNTLLILCCFFLLFECKAQNGNLKTGFENYRYNPFQFPYPEYNLKADSVFISSVDHSTIPNSIKIDYFGFQSYIDSTIFDSIVSRGDRGYYFYKNNKKVFIILFNKDSLIGCSDSESRSINRDFCSAFSSNKEYFQKLYTLTPDDLNKRKYFPLGNSWIVHQKGIIFQDIKSISIHIHNEFIAFRRDYNLEKNLSVSNGVVVFHNNLNPNYSISFAFSTSNELLVKQLLTTMSSDKAK
jgi:hypothetical protein